jgi:hypothetical protein
MSKSEEYRRKAEECDALAAKATDPDAKRLLTQIAADWRSMAKQVEKWETGGWL